MKWAGVEVIINVEYKVPTCVKFKVYRVFLSDNFYPYVHTNLVTLKIIGSCNLFTNKYLNLGMYFVIWKNEHDSNGPCW